MFLWLFNLRYRDTGKCPGERRTGETQTLTYIETRLPDLPHTHTQGLGTFIERDSTQPFRLKLTHNPSQNVQPQIFKTKLSIWVCSIGFNYDKVEV